MGEECGGELWPKNMICQPSSKLYPLSEILYPAPGLHDSLGKVLSNIRMKWMSGNRHNRWTQNWYRERCFDKSWSLPYYLSIIFEAFESHFHLDGGNKSLANFYGHQDEAEDSTPVPTWQC